MRTLSFFFIALFTAYYFRIDIANYQVAQIINHHQAQIRFFGSVLPVYCQLEKLKTDFGGTNPDFTSFTNTVNTIAQETLPELGNAVSNIAPYSPESMRLKEAINQLYQVSYAETTELNTVITNWKTSDGLWDYLVAAYSTYTFASDFEEAKNKIENSREQVESATDVYINSLTKEIQVIVNDNILLAVLYQYILTDKDKVELKGSIYRQVVNEIEKNTYTNSGCVKDQLYEIQNQFISQ